MKIRICDYIAKYIYEVLGVDTVFMLTGGGAIFLNDGIAKYGKFQVVSNHHEQAGAMGAVAYSKYTRGISIVIPTTGCGGTNTMTGLLDAWQDGCPVLFISGQVNEQNTRLRQSGVQ